MTTVVTGTDGPLGAAVAALLRADGEAVVDVPSAALQRLDAGAGADAVVHAAPALTAPRGSGGAHVVGGTAALLAALAPRCRVVHVSSTAVYGHDRPWPAEVSTSADPRTALGVAHDRAEQRVRGALGTRAVVVRLAPLRGDGVRGSVEEAAAWFVRRRVAPGDGTSRVHLVDVDDAAAGLVAALRRGQGTDLLAGARPVRAQHLLAAVASRLGTDPPRAALPAAVARAVAGAVERAGASPCAVTAQAVDVLTRDRAFSWARAAEGLGWRPADAAADGYGAAVPALDGSGADR